MKVITRHICGEDRVLCYSLRVTKAVTERFGTGGIREKLKESSTAETLDAVIWMLTLMMEAGKKYADKNGIPCPPSPTEDDMLDCYGMDDLEELYGDFTDTMAAGQQQGVEAEAKNGSAGQKEASTLPG